MALYTDAKIEINLNELVAIRGCFLGEQLTAEEVDEIAGDLRIRLTWDTLYGMVDDSILEYLDKSDKHYGETQPEPGREAWLNQIEKNKKQFEMVKLTSPSWEIEVPRRIKK
tara:strand:- start:675 stop:1010 length:336 start_codon:yes stop_codon:yes gene_type:complete